MSIRNFKTAFSIVFALILGFIGLSIGLAIRSAIPALTVYPIWLETFVGFAKVNPNYLNGVTGALCALGVLFGTIIGPKAAQTLINAGNSLEQMSAKDKIAVGFGTVIGIAISTPFFIFGSRNAIGLSLAILLAVAFVYLGIRATLSMKDEFRFIGGAAAAQVVEEAAREVVGRGHDGGLELGGEPSPGQRADAPDDRRIVQLLARGVLREQEERDPVLGEPGGVPERREGLAHAVLAARASLGGADLENPHRLQGPHERDRPDAGQQLGQPPVRHQVAGHERDEAR